MKIVHLCYWDLAGGASIAAYKLHRALIKCGYTSSMIVLNKNTNDENVYSLRNKFVNFFINLCNRLSSLLLKKYRPYTGNFSINLWGLDISNHPLINDADIIYIHWINNSMFSLRGLKSLIEKGKIIHYFLHDMYLLTGGCHHSLECEKYTIHCGACNILKSSKNKDISYIQFEEKIKCLKSHSNIKIIVPSSWMANCVRKSFLFSEKVVKVIPNSINTEEFQPLNKIDSRCQLGLPNDMFLIAFGADNGPSNPYKGWQYLEQAVKMLPKTIKFAIVTFGGDEIKKTIVDGITIYSMGRINSSLHLSKVYSACDIFAMPSIAESFGQTAVESLCCGTPVIGFNNTGLSDIIEHQKNGYLADYRDVEDFKYGIECFLKKIDDNLRFEFHSYIKNKFDTSHIVLEHIKLFDR